MIRIALVLAAAMVWAAPAAAQRIHQVRDAAGFRRAVNAARPGDRILLAPGDYTGNFYFKNVHGSAGQPIVIAAANPKKPPRFIGDFLCIQFSGASYLELSDLLLTRARANGLNIDDAENVGKPAHHITLRNLQVAGIGSRGNHDGIKLSGVDDFLLVDCKVEGWGKGGSAIDMVGCHTGVIAKCNFKKGGANAVQMKGGSSEVTVSRCTFEDCGDRAINVGGRTDAASFRPPVKSMPAQGKYEARSIRIEGCLFLGGEAAIAFVGVDGAVARYNTIYRPSTYALRFLQENVDEGFVPCRNIRFEKNVVVFRSETWRDGGVNVGPGTAPESFQFSGNLWYCQDRPERSQPRLPTAEKDGIVGKNPLFHNVRERDFSVDRGSPAADRGAHALPIPQSKPKSKPKE